MSRRPRLPGFRADRLWQRLSDAQDAAIAERPLAGAAAGKDARSLAARVATRGQRKGRTRRAGIIALSLGSAAAAAALVVYQAPVADMLGLRRGPETAVQSLVADARSDLPLQFSDGSTVTFRAGSAGRMRRLGDRGADVVLERGTLEAHVVHAATTLWLVHAGPYRVRVTGTRFSMSWVAANLEVALHEGSVVVDGALLGAGVPLRAGHRLKIASGVVLIEPFGPLALSTPASTPAKSGTDEDDPPSSAPEPTVAPAGDGDSEAQPVAVGVRAAAADSTPSRMARVSHRQAAPDDEWLALADRGAYSEALLAARRLGWGALCRRLDAHGLLTLGDVARYSGAHAQARRAFEALVARFPRDRLAPDAVFSLGRLAFESRRPDEARRWFRRYVADWPRGPLADQAAGRLVECAIRMEDRDAARGAARAPRICHVRHAVRRRGLPARCWISRPTGRRDAVRGGPRRFAALVLATTCATAILISGAPRSANGAPAIVGVVASSGSRLANDLKRELEASRFAVVSVEVTGRDWRIDARRLSATKALHGVVVRADEQVMTVITLVAGSTDIQARFEQKVESDDRLARRRACVGVVEYLRVLIENDAAPSIDLGGASPTPSTPVPAPTASVSVSPTPSSAPAPAAVPGTGVGGKAPVPAPSPSRATDSNTPASNPSVSVEASASGSPPVGSVVAEPERLWELGIGTTLGLAAAPGGPTAHLQFIWYLPLDWRLAVCIRGHWPVLGGQFRTDGNEVRTWTFGAGASMQYLFDLGATRWQPFVGTSLGSRVALTETSPLEGVQSRKTFTPSGYLSVETGVRYALGPRTKLFVEAGLARGWLIPGVRRLSYEEDAANADSFHASFGALFEI